MSTKPNPERQRSIDFALAHLRRLRLDVIAQREAVAVAYRPELMLELGEMREALRALNAIAYEGAMPAICGEACDHVAVAVQSLQTEIQRRIDQWADRAERENPEELPF